jgi:O-antigen ligase
MLFLSLLIRYVFGETILTVLGFGDKVSVWDGSGPPPIYHGIPGAAVVRFQGMLEGPNQMAFFLLTYLGTYLTLFFRYKKYRFINSVITLLLVFLLTQTYSRSGLLGLMVGSAFLIFSYIVHKIRTWKQGFSWKKIAWKKIITTTLLVSLGGILVLFQFGPKFTEIITRK